MNRTKAFVLALFAAYWVIVAVTLVAARAVYDHLLAQAVPLSGNPRPSEIGTLLALTVLLALLSTGVIRGWRWTFWLILVVFLIGIARLPVSALQLAGIMPRKDPAWYVALQAAVGLIQFGVGVAPVAPSGKLASRLTQVVVAGTGVLLTAAMVTVVLVHASPPAPSTPVPAGTDSQVHQGYTALAPGPDCDTGTATWHITPVDTVTTCSEAGTTLPLGSVASTAGTQQITLEFIPPSGSFPGDYQVSLHVDFQGQTQACLGLTTRYDGIGGYLSDVCASGAWDVTRIDPDATPVLASGRLAQPLASATVNATARGNSLSLSVDGAVVTSISDATYDQTEFVGLSVTSPTGGTAILSHFSYMPLDG